MKKKILSIMMCALAVLTTSTMITSCDGTPKKSEHTTHVYDKKITSNNKYRKSPATCTEPALYYYSCICGDKGTETFEHGSPRGHFDELTISGEYKTNYLPGETFDATGIVVNRKCLDCEDEGVVTEYTISPNEPLTAGTTKVTLSTADTSVDITITVANVAITDVNLSLEGSNVFYVLSGVYSADYNLTADSIYFDLATVRNSYYYIEKEDVVFAKNETNHTFTLKADVTNWSNNSRPLFPHLHIEEETKNVVDVTNQWNGNSVTANDSIYTIVQTDDTYNMPTLVRTYTGEPAGVIDYTKTTASDYSKMVFGDNIYYQATAAEYKVSGEKVFINISGTSKGFSFAQLEAELGFQVRSGITDYYVGTDGGPLTFDSGTGNWKLECNVTSLPSGITYYTRFGEGKSATNYNVFDFDTLTVDQVTGEGESVTIGNKKYSFIYEPTASTSDLAWGTIGIKVEKAEL